MKKIPAVHKLFEKSVKVKRVFKGNAVNFNEDVVRLVNGKTATREYIDHPGAAAALPITDKGEIVMVRQFRYPVGEVTWEIPAGKCHGAGDDPLRRARHELREETGYTARSVKKLITFWPCCAFSNETLPIYLATGLKPGPMSPDEDEFLHVMSVPLDKALKMIKSGAIKDSKTVIAILMYAAGIRGK